MNRIVTEQFIDLLRREGEPVAQLVRVTPLKDREVITRGASIQRQQYKVDFEGGYTLTFVVIHGEIKRVKAETPW